VPTKSRYRLARYLWLPALFVLSCDLTTLVRSAPSLPSPVPGALNTIVAQTAAAAYTGTASNATVIPTLTSTLMAPPTATPTVAPTETPTFIFRLSTFTPTRLPTATAASSGSSSATGQGCQLVSQSPDDGTHFDAKKTFTASWKVKNTGSDTWDSNSVDFAFFSGTKMYTGATLHDLPSSVAVGDSITLTIAMAAPKDPGSYKTVWALRLNKNDFCHVNLRIVVP
jgi:hypothetical protein